MSTLPGRTGAIALTLSFAATFGVVIGVAGTASDLLTMPPARVRAPGPDVRPPPPTVHSMRPWRGEVEVVPALDTGLVVDWAGVSLDGHHLDTAGEVLADRAAVADRLRARASVARQDPLLGPYGLTLRFESDGSAAVALAAAAAAFEAGFAYVLIVPGDDDGPYFACELDSAPTAAAIAAAKGGTIETACAVARAQQDSELRARDYKAGGLSR